MAAAIEARFSSRDLIGRGNFGDVYKGYGWCPTAPHLLGSPQISLTSYCLAPILSSCKAGGGHA